MATTPFLPGGGERHGSATGVLQFNPCVQPLPMPSVPSCCGKKMRQK